MKMKNVLVSMAIALGLTGCADSKAMLSPEDATIPDAGIEARLDMAVEEDEKPGLSGRDPYRRCQPCARHRRADPGRNLSHRRPPTINKGR